VLKIIIERDEIYDEEKNEFRFVNSIAVNLEHSLASLSKWESKYQKPFLGQTPKTNEEIFDYIQMMVVDDIDPNCLFDLSDKNYAEIQNYINDPQTATTFRDIVPSRPSSQIITAEIIYYWMVTYNIPLECENWHLNRLFALVKVCNAKNTKPQKIPQRELARRNQELNAQRRAALGTSG
jgi:hypothetical protein